MGFRNWILEYLSYVERTGRLIYRPWGAAGEDYQARIPVFMWVLFTFFTLANTTDLVTSAFILPAEANPIYLAIGSVIPLYILKVFLNVYFGWVLWRRHYASETAFYIFCFVLTYAAVIFALGAAYNIYGIMNPEVVMNAAATPASKKAAAFGIWAGIVYVAPFIVSWAGFEVFNRNRKFMRFNHVQKAGVVEQRTRRWYHP